MEGPQPPEAVQDEGPGAVEGNQLRLELPEAVQEDMQLGAAGGKGGKQPLSPQVDRLDPDQGNHSFLLQAAENRKLLGGKILCK